MASVALMSPPIKKEPDVLVRSSLLPKRKSILPNIAVRSRFVKPQPNVIASAAKPSKESLPSSSENAKAEIEVPTQPVETESAILPRPAISKRAATVPALSRARFQKAKPNIGLSNKSAKDVSTSEKKSLPTTDGTKKQEVYDVKLDTTAPSETELSSKEISNESKSLPVFSSSSVKQVDDLESSVTESPFISQPTSIDIDSVCQDYQEISSIRTTPEDTTLESHTEIPSSQPDVPIKESEAEVCTSHDSEASLVSPRAALENTPEKESPSVSVPVNKNTEYPTLKNILNSPRKRTATKKVHERRKRVTNLSANPSRSEMTMVDLIYWNPSGSPMKEVQAPAPVEADLLPEDDPQPSPEETENSNVGPKVIINDDGEIILDESSLFVRRKDTVDHSVAAVIENDNTTYSSYRNRYTKTWSKRETVKFYKALSLVGTDFALMESIFREDGKVTRTRRELKLKFKREEKSNPKFVHTAIYELQTYDFDILDDDQDIEFLDESEIIDDAPKQVKRTATSGTKPPGKRGRKKKSEIEEVTINEDTSESIHGMGDEIGEVTNLSSEVSRRNDNEAESNSTLSASRPARERKTKILSDYVTDIDNLSDASENEEVLPIKKRKIAQILSDEEDITEANNDNGADKEIMEAEHIGNIKMCETLPTISEEVVEIRSPESDRMLETSRSGRKIKVKKMSDFITDTIALDDSNDAIIPIIKVEDLDEVNMVSNEENVRNLNAVECCNSSQLAEEYSVIPPAKADGEYPIEENIIFTLNVENPNGSNLVIESSNKIDQDKSNNPELISTIETISSVKSLDSEIVDDITTNNILSDPAITEVVVTSDKIPRRARRKVLPNVIKGSKRPPIQKPLLPPPRRTSFTSFTPVEEIVPKSTFIPPSKTYSKQTISEDPDDMPEYLETVQKSPMNILRKRSLSGAEKSPCSQSINTNRTNSMCITTRSPLQNAPLNVFSFNSSIVPSSSIELQQTPDPKPINMNPENLTESSPMVFLTRTPNNSNMLHLFVYKNP